MDALGSVCLGVSPPNPRGLSPKPDPESPYGFSARERPLFVSEVLEAERFKPSVAIHETSFNSLNAPQVQPIVQTPFLSEY